jgi:hypothetical protein
VPRFGVLLCLGSLGLLGAGCDSGGRGEVTAAECSDGLDNDGDGAVDCGDVGCGAHAFCDVTLADGGTPPPPPPSCGPSNCGGCCSGDTCLGGNSASACGSGGAICVDCGPGRLCSGGVCTIDPASRWNVIVESVEVSTTSTGGGAWDPFGGAPDPYVNVEVGAPDGDVGNTSSGSNTFTVRYDQRVATDLRADALWTFLAFHVYDEDPDTDDWIGACKYEPLGEGAFDETTVTLTCDRVPADGQAGFTLRWRLERN